MFQSSRNRRRLIALGSLAGGALLAWCHNLAPWPWLAKIVAPAAVLYGLIGLVYPAAIHDFIRPEFGALQLWMETGSRGFHVGMTATLFGVLVGLAWAFGAF
jgi:hypothetical protein